MQCSSLESTIFIMDSSFRLWMRATLNKPGKGKDYLRIRSIKREVFLKGFVQPQKSCYSLRTIGEVTDK